MTVTRKSSANLDLQNSVLQLFLLQKQQWCQNGVCPSYRHCIVSAVRGWVAYYSHTTHAVTHLQDNVLVFHNWL